MPQTQVTTDQDSSDALAGGALASGVASAVGTFEAGRTSKMLAQFNANYARTQADQAAQAGAFAATRRRVVANVLAGRTEAAQAGGGTVVGAGSNRAVLASQRAGSATDEYLDQLNAGRQGEALRVRAAGAEFQGAQARTTGEMQAMSTLLNTGEDAWLLQDPSYDPRFGRGVPLQH